MVFEARILVSGDVTGVGYRSFCKRLAQELGLKGYAKNLPNGGVEVLVQGQKEKIDALVQALKQRKPFLARIEKVQVLEQKNLRSGEETFVYFEIQ